MVGFKQLITFLFVCMLRGSRCVFDINYVTMTCVENNCINTTPCLDRGFDYRLELPRVGHSNAFTRREFRPRYDDRR